MRTVVWSYSRGGLIHLYSGFTYLPDASLIPASESVPDGFRESQLTFYSLTFDVQYC